MREIKLNRNSITIEIVVNADIGKAKDLLGHSYNILLDERQ